MNENSRKFNKEFNIWLILLSLVLASHISVSEAQTEETSKNQTYNQRKSNAIKTMAELLATKNPPSFFVTLFKYYIEGQEYFSSGLTVSEGRTPNLTRTPTGFECDAYFPPEMVHPKAREGGRVQKNGLVKVRLKANLEDIHMIVMFREDGSQAILYQ